MSLWIFDLSSLLRASKRSPSWFSEMRTTSTGTDPGASRPSRRVTWRCVPTLSAGFGSAISMPSAERLWSLHEPSTRPELQAALPLIANWCGSAMARPNH